MAKTQWCRIVELKEQFGSYYYVAAVSNTSGMVGVDLTSQGNTVIAKSTEPFVHSTESLKIRVAETRKLAAKLSADGWTLFENERYYPTGDDLPYLFKREVP